MDVETLRPISFLKTLDEAELQMFSELLTLREVAPKETILREGEPVQHFYIVCHGTVHARRMGEKHAVLLGRIPPGGFFGEINLFDTGVATASVEAIGKVTLAIVSYETLKRFMSGNTAIGYKIVSALMGELAQRLRRTNERFMSSLYWSANTPT